MSMLVERRRKTKWTLNPGRKALWKTDSDGAKLGKKLMEKMGWRVGQGLGVHEQGMTEPLKVSFKSDSKGVGFKSKDNEWIQQQQDFNELLQKLSSANDTEIGQLDNKKGKQAASLEEKSKHSKARVHYSKFTRVKDMSKYSEKDLECILGNKRDSSEVAEKNEGNMNGTSSTAGTDYTTFNAGSMVDYFAHKMKNKVKVVRISSSTFVNEDGETDKCSFETDEKKYQISTEGKVEEAKKQEKKKKKLKNLYETESVKELGDVMYAEHLGPKTLTNDLSEICDVQENMKVSERGGNSAGNLQDVKNSHDTNEFEGEMGVDECEMDSKCTESSHYRGHTSNNLDCNQEEFKKKKKKRKRSAENTQEHQNVNQIGEYEIFANGKKKKLNDCNEEFNGKVECAVFVPESNSRKSAEINEKDETIINEEDNKEIQVQIHVKVHRMKKKSRARDDYEKTESDAVDVIHHSENKLDSANRQEAELGGNSRREERKTEEESTEDTKNRPAADLPIYKERLLKTGTALRNITKNKTLNLLYCINMEKFRGSNLGTVKGYGIVRYLKN